MPKYNGIIAYPIEVLLHLLKCYAVIAIFLCVVLPAPLVLAWAFSGNGVEVAAGFLTLFASAPGLTFGWVHLAVFAIYRVYFAPRFPYAPSWVTFAFALTFGAIALALASYAPSPFEVSLEPDAAGWLQALERLSFVERAGLAALLTAAAAVVGGLLLILGGMGRYTWGLSKWLGWLIVGRAAFDAFVERETLKLNREYDEYVKSIRRG